MVLVYLLETSVCLGFTLLIYRFVLSELTFFAWNRAILLALLVLSFVIPTLSLDYFGIGGEEVVREMTLPVFQVGEQISSNYGKGINFLEYAVWIYLIGVFFTAARMIFGLLISQRLIDKATLIFYRNQWISIHPQFVPASFFSYILMPSFDPNDRDQEQIFIHESMHVRYRHSWDLVLVNFGKIIFWFNPLIYLFEKSLREVHEFQADQGVTRAFSPREYATLLLRLVTARPGWQFMNNFNQFQTKKRIQMIAKRSSASFQKLRFLAVIPAIGALLFVFSCEKEELLSTMTGMEDFPETMEIPFTQKQEASPKAEEPIFKNVPNPSLESADEVFDVVEQQPNPEGGMNGWNMYLARNIKYPLEARQLGVEGVVIVVFEIHTDGSIHNVEILRGIGGGADEEAIRVVANAPKWEPGRQRGRAVKTRMRLPIRFKMQTAIQNTLETSLPELPIASEGQLKQLTVFGYHNPDKQ
jgi:TonB family protein